MTQPSPSHDCDLPEVHRQSPTCQSVSPEAQGDATKSPNDDFQDLRIAVMALGDPSDEMLTISDGLRSFVERGQNTSIYSTAQALYDGGVARSTNANMALRKRQALDKRLRSELATDKRQHVKSKDTNIGRDADGIPVQQHKSGESVENNASVGRLLERSEEFARGLARLENGTLFTDPQSSRISDFNRDLVERNRLRQTQQNATVIGNSFKELDKIDKSHDPCLKEAQIRRKFEINIFYDSFDSLYQSASSASDDNRTSVRVSKRAKEPEHKETVEKLQCRMLQQAAAIRDDCAVLLSYLNWINREKEWGLLDEGRYKAHYLARRLMKSVEDGPVPQSILEALDAPTTCATSLDSGDPHTIAIDRTLGHDHSSSGQKSSTLEDKLRQALNYLRNTNLETDGSTQVGDINNRRIRKLMRTSLSRSVLATFSEDMTKAVHDLFLTFTILNTMRPDLYTIRKQAKTAVITWTRASYKAWFIGYINWHEVPVTQKYEQQRIEYLAMCETARILHEKLAPHLRFFRKELPRVRVSKAGSDADKRCNRVRRSWDMHIQIIKHMFPLVANMIYEAGALVCRGARSETHDLDIQQELEAKLHYWKMLDEDDDYLADEGGKEYWNMLLLCNGCS